MSETSKISVAQLRAYSKGAEATNDARFAKKTDFNTASGKLDTLIGSDTGKSARTIAAEELAAQLIPANAQEALDTIGEIAAWIQDHPGDVATINAAILAIQTKLELGTYDDDGDDVEYATVKAYVEAVQTVLETAIAGKVDKITGKGLSTNDFTDAYKAAIDNADMTAYTGSGAIDVTNHVISISEATSSAAGAMSASDKAKLDGITNATSDDIASIVNGMYKTYVAATGTYVAGTTYYTDNTGAVVVDSSEFEAGVTSVASYFVEQA